jgi:hypothetical protein
MLYHLEGTNKLIQSFGRCILYHLEGVPKRSVLSHREPETVNRKGLQQNDWISLLVPSK